MKRFSHKYRSKYMWEIYDQDTLIGGVCSHKEAEAMLVQLERNRHNEFWGYDKALAKPCPECGTLPESVNDDVNDDGMMMYICPKCHLSTAWEPYGEFISDKLCALWEWNNGRVGFWEEGSFREKHV